MGNLDITMMNYSYYIAHLGLVWFYMVLWQSQQLQLFQVCFRNPINIWFMAI